MAEIHAQFHEAHLTSRIGEMGPLDSLTDDIPVPAEFLEKVKASDEKPMFVTVEIESGMSGSKRKWKPEHVRRAVEKVNSRRMSGYLGHPLLDKKEYETGFPKPQVVWVAAKVQEIGDKAIGKFKGYVLKAAEAKDYLKLGLIDGVSWFGDTTMRPLAGGGYEVIEFDPETIDFARKGRSGMKSRVVSLTGEMETEGGWNVEPREIAALSVDEVKTHAPLLFKAIQDDATAPLDTKIGEQATAIAAAEPEVEITKEIRKLLGLTEGENPVEKVTNLIAQVEESAKSEIKDFIKSLVAKKVKTPRGQAVLARMIGEMHTGYDGPLTDDLKTKIETDFNAKIEGDEDMKALVGEMQGWKDEPNKDDPGNSTRQGGSTMGGRSRVGEMRQGDQKEEDGVVRRTSNLTIRKAKLSA